MKVHTLLRVLDAQGYILRNIETNIGTLIDDSLSQMQQYFDKTVVKVEPAEFECAVIWYK